MKSANILKIMLLALFPLVGTAQTLCVSKTDYDSGAGCSGTFVATTPEELASYGKNYGLENGKYKSLKITHALKGKNVTIHSPCKVFFSPQLTHRAKNVCIDGREGVVLEPQNIFLLSGDLGMVSTQGKISSQMAGLFQVRNLEISAAGGLFLGQGTRAEVASSMKWSSSFRDDQKLSIGIGRGSRLWADSVSIESEGKIRIEKNTYLASRHKNMLISTLGQDVSNEIFLQPGVELRSERNLTMDGGNLVAIRGNAKVSAWKDLIIKAKGCRIAGNATFEGENRSGTCLDEGRGFNHHPTANMVATPRSGGAPLTVNLDASSSEDPDGTIQNYEWSFSDGTVLTGAKVEKIFFRMGTERIVLTVTDDDGAQARRKEFVAVTSTSSSPVARFTYNPVEGEAPLTVILDGSGSVDPNGTVVGYEWIFDDGVTLEGVTQRRTFETAGTYTVSLEVTDSEGLTHRTEPAVITVTEPNAPPVMGVDQTIQGIQNKPLTFSLNGATDEDGDSLSYALVNPPASGTLSGCLKGTDRLDCIYTPEQDFTGEVIFSYKANDGNRDSERVAMVTLEIMPPRVNVRPSADAGSDQTAVFGDAVTLDGSGSRDPEGAELTWFWTIVSRPLLSDIRLAVADTARPEFIADRDGTYIFRLTVNDGESDSLPDEVTVMVTGEINTAPVLDAIASPRSLQVGQELRFTVSGTDADSHDSPEFMARGLPPNARFSGTTREFRFQPLPDQVGDHKITFVITDGKETATQNITITVLAPDPAQPTALSSRVLDGTAMDKGQTVPLAGVKVSVEGSEKVAVSDTQDYFSLSDIPSGAKIVSLDASAVTANDGSRYGDFKGRLKIMPNVHNRPHRDYMLPRLDSAGMAMVEPVELTMVDNQNLGVTMLIPPGKAKMSDGQDYSGPLSISMVPVNSAPRELPENLRPNFLITLQPVNVRFANPVPIVFPNLDNLPPGSLVGLTSLSERGGFEQVGVGQVTADGKSIRTIRGGIRATTWHAVTTIRPEAMDSPRSPNNNRDVKEAVCGGSIICLSSGVLKEEHVFPRFRDSGESVAYSMGYKNPISMEKMVLFQQFRRRMISFGRARIVPPPPLMGLAYAFAGSESEPTYFSTDNILVGDDGDFKDFLLANRLDTSGLTTGFHPAEVIRIGVASRITEDNPVPSRTSEREAFSLEVISPDTEFGWGWRFQEVHRLYGEGGSPDRESGRIMLVFGNFSSRIFTKESDGTYTSPGGDYSTLEAILAPAEGFVRTMKDGMRYVFDGEGFLIGREDRYGRGTEYHYTVDGKLSDIVHHGGNSSRFVYGTDGRIDSVTDPVGRITRFEHDSDGYLTKITEPDGKSRLFRYSNRGTLLSQTDKLGRVRSYAYDWKGSVIRTVRPDGTRIIIDSAASRLASSFEGTLENPIPVLVAQEADHFISDSKGNFTKYRTNRFGTFTRDENPDGGVRSYAYDGNNNLLEVVDENGNREQQNTWNRHGDVLSSHRSDTGTTLFRYAANPADNYHQPVETLDEIEDYVYAKTIFSYDSYGNVTGITYPDGHKVRMGYKRGYFAPEGGGRIRRNGEYF